MAFPVKGIAVYALDDLPVTSEFADEITAQLNKAGKYGSATRIDISTSPDISKTPNTGLVIYVRNVKDVVPEAKNTRKSPAKTFLLL